MKFLFLITLLSLPHFTMAQDKPEIVIHSSSLGIGDYIKFGEKSIRFKEVVSDSRCPRSVTCIWAGEAKILVDIFKNGKFIEEILITTNASVDPVNFALDEILYSISAINLLPYPSIEKNNKELKYTLHLKVKENL